MSNRRSKNSLLTMPHVSRADKRRKKKKKASQRQKSHPVDREKMKQARHLAITSGVNALVNYVQDRKYYVPLSVMHNIREEHPDCRKSTDAIMYAAIRQFNERKQMQCGVYAHYVAGDRKIYLRPNHWTIQNIFQPGICQAFFIIDKCFYPTILSVANGLAKRK